MTQNLTRYGMLALLIVTIVAPALAADGPAVRKSSAPAVEGVVNINTADVKELALLPGIGDATAKRIVEHRQKNGTFKAVEELMNVRGIGEGTFSKLKPYLAVTGSTTIAAKKSGR